MLYVDITNVLKTAFSIPTGIPRVEHSIAEYFLADAGEARGIYFRSNDWFIVSDERANSLRSLLESSVEGSVPGAYRDRLRWGLATIWRALRPLDKELHRAVASRVGNGQRKGLVYALHKMAFRAVGAASALAASARSVRLAEKLREEDRMLVSLITVMMAPERVLAPPFDRHSSVLLYDTTPLDQPDMTTKKIAARFPGAFTLAMERARGVICISDFTRDRARHWASRLRLARTSPLAVFRLSSPLIEKSVAPQPLPDAFHRPFVLFCATIEPRKNHLMLLRVWRRLLDVVPGRPPLLVLVGKVGWKAEATLAFLDADPRLRESVALVGDADDAMLATLYRRARFTVFPSVAEGWGLGASESLDFEIPVIISTCPALIEATSGLMPAIDPEDEEGWFRAILRLLTDDAALEELRGKVRNGYRHLPTRESMDEISHILLPSADEAA